MRVSFVVVFVALISAPAMTAESDIMLVGERSGGGEWYFVLQPDQGKAQFVDPDPMVVGQLIVRENVYVMKFPATKSRWETWVRVNRYSGKMEFEAGKPPFFARNFDNVLSLGKCRQTLAKKLF